jgi:hypothetical protein
MARHLRDLEEPGDRRRCVGQRCAREPFRWIARAAPSLLGLGLAVAALPASAQTFDGGLAGYCQYIPPPGSDQPFTLTGSIPSGRTVHVAVVTSTNVTLGSVSDAASDPYAVVGGGVSGAFTSSLLVAEVASALPSGNSITVHLTATGGGGTSCASAFLASGALATPDQNGFATGSGATASVTTPPLGSPHELVQAILFGSPTGSDPTAARVPPLVDAGSNVCVGTSSGRLCSYGSYAVLDSADPFTGTVDLGNSMSWGFAFATFAAPEPSASLLGVASLGALLAWRRRRARAPAQALGRDARFPDPASRSSST